MTCVNHERILATFRAEAERLAGVVGALSEREWDRPTACEPWRVRELLGHVRVVIGWLPDMLDGPAPARAQVSAREYYRPDERFSAETNAARIALAVEYAAAQDSGVALAEDFTDTWENAYRLCRAEPPGRVIVTRHGDAMLLSDFLLTRVVEVAVHGLDLAAALEREPWLTSQAGDAVEELLLEAEDVARVRGIGWDQVTFLRKATGREPISPDEAEWVRGLGVRWLTLG
ncbi:TIGR03083 family protein [Thermomonospora echinospora]|uniref:TIGR03083 family protein n=1 Tax=Thermomonospora echinospora TaxID=1992 RepID=A0A1H5ZE11_9ACTN|nr:maleylpyruvate isomerase N-terminal domain-containing protein [Thermomonospora echinospora]SEG34688.1 TIGR03083 family protein [Thermomonospora echinospora]